MAQRINLDTDTVTLKDLFKQVEDWEISVTSELTNDQLAIINLKRLIDFKDDAGDFGGGKECFICFTGA